MYTARLGGVSGVADVRSRARSGAISEYRGLFAFGSQHENEMVYLFQAKRPIEFNGFVDGEQRRLTVTLISLDLVSGIAFFEGSGESTEAFRQTGSQAR